MIYSPDHKFLLIKNLKVGGTSLEVELSKVLPNNAIVTKIYPENINHQPKNFDGFYNHMPYSEIKDKIDLSDVRSYVFVRNPYTTVLSDFFVRLKFNNINLEDLDKKLKHYFNTRMLTGTNFLYTINGSICVDKILYYENGIEEEINSVLPDNGIEKIKVTALEKQYRPKWADYKNLFTREYLDKINCAWEWEFNNLGYEVE